MPSGILFVNSLVFTNIPQTQKRFEKLFKKSPKSLKYKGLRRFQGGIFFVNAPQRKGHSRVSFLRWRRHPHIESGSARPSGAAESGSHSPLGDRQARLPGVECANIRAKREIPESASNAS